MTTRPYVRKTERNTNYRGVRDRTKFRAFTIRLPNALYDKLLAKAVAEKRSVAAQVEAELGDLK